jgi:hypothetical protein
MQENETQDVESLNEVVKDTTETISELTNGGTNSVDTPTLSPSEQIVSDLETERMGSFKVGLGYGDAVYFRNLLDKSEYKGPQQAYLLVIAKSELSSICVSLKDSEKDKRFNVDLTSACIESLGFFMNSFEGKGADSATKLFTASMLLRPAMGIINNLDVQLAEAKKNIESIDK